MKAMAGRSKRQFNVGYSLTVWEKKLKMQALKLEVSVKAKNLPGHVLSEQTNNDLREQVSWINRLRSHFASAGG
jgi:hypothetical protein